MCGICGYISKKDININEMNNSIAHRGPDNQSTYVNRDIGLGLGHVRLSILDLSPQSNQPMVSQSGRYRVVYNGETYNFMELRRELERLGTTFRTNSDTEVIVEGFEQWGTTLFEKLNGMFAFVIYDKELNRLYIARDRFGVKPLYFYSYREDFIFASEIKAIMASDIVEKNLNYQGLYEYLHYATTLGETTFYDNIKKLEAGHYIKYDIDKRVFEIEKYRVNYEVESVEDSLEDAITKTRELFEASVERQLVSDVPIGIFLSGGVDSTAITAYATKHYRGGRVKTFSAGFDFDDGVNELPNAKFISNYFGTEHHELHISGGNTVDVLEKVNHHFDQPFGDAANIPLYLMSRELKGKEKVVLQGDGGDELFAGYHRYGRLNHYRTFKSISKLFPLLKIAIPKDSAKYRGLRFLYALGQKDLSKEMAYILSQEMFDENPADYFSKDINSKLKTINPFQRYQYFYNKFRDLDSVNRALYTDMNIILPDLYFEKVDRATMANSLEVRVPFLDNELVDYAMGLPSKYKVKGQEKKYLLKRAFKGVVPDKILYGAKRGFSVPFQYWLRTSMKDFMFDHIRSSQIYNVGIEQMMQEHILGKKDNGYILWKLLNLVMWLKKTGVKIA
ncbi:Asparagine synthetase [glutamine-hydrolyzing] [hydrothermal vent metagenome]|uniref:Asparagine synthetase [glutamine-hydrolyzing] n=1 Tax=hydrothermal vent metagenome TaxID=652676 RepID=A0A1W1BUN5_9ZZZZ